MAQRRAVADQRGGNLALDLFVVDQHLGTLLDAAFTGTGVTPTEYAVYSQLGPKAQTPGQLRDALGMRAATLSGHLATLEQRGHVSRTRNERDGRSHILALTEAGRAQLELCRPRLRLALRALTRQLGGRVEVDAIRAVLLKIDDGMIAATADLLASAARRA